MFVTAPTRSRDVSAPALRRLFDLTPAEAEVVADLVAGHTVSDIAERRRAAVGTVRNHLHVALGKTGTTRQPELAGAIRRLMPFGALD